MQSSLEKLRKFFRLEAENKYANTAVIGGLAKILDFWEAEARNEAVPEDLVQLVVTRLRDYERLTPASRADTLKGVWKRIQNQTGETDIPSPVYVEESPKSEPAPAKQAGPEAAVAEAAAPEAAPVPNTAPAPSRPPQAPKPAQNQKPAQNPGQRPRSDSRREPQVIRRSPPPRASTYPGAQTSQTPVALNASLTVLQGVGPKNAASLEKLGL